MITYTQGNLLDAQVDALVNTVNTVGVMGKGIALMFKERFPKNMAEYARACKANTVVIGKMFVTETGEPTGPRWIVNFPTKQHWRAKSKMEWIQEGLLDLKRFILENNIRSIAIPPLGAGNGGLNWRDVKVEVVRVLADLEDTDIIIYEPTANYQNVAKTVGVKKLTPARALIAELVRRYWILGMECSLLEIQKLAWFLQRVIVHMGIKNALNLQFAPNNYGPYAHNLQHLLNALDGSYLKSEKRIPDCSPLDVIWFNDNEKQTVSAYLQSEAKSFLPALEAVSDIIDGFESPFGMELLSTVDWLVTMQSCHPSVESIKEGIKAWPAGEIWAQRKLRLFDDEDIGFALKSLEKLVA